MVGKITLDIARDRFEAAPHLPENIATLLTVAMRYWDDDMISDETFCNYVRKARDWIKEAPIDPKPSKELYERRKAALLARLV